MSDSSVETTSELVLVTGATGQTGALVAEGLRARGVPVREAARGTDPRFDWDDPATWDAVLDGATAAYLVTPLVPDFAPGLVGDFTARARAAGVRRLVLLSGASAEFGNVPILSREMPLRAVDQDDFSWTILRPSAFAQNFPAMERTLLADGGVRRPLGPAPGAAVAYIDVRDIADVAVEILASAEPDQVRAHAGRTYYLDGPEALGYEQVLDAIGSRIGRELRYEDAPRDEWAAGARAAGVEEVWLRWRLDLFAQQRRGEYAHTRDDVERLLGRRPRRFDAYLADSVSADSWPEG
ncbi:NAD(P)H-binding protein [Murinocardiopsis flavida]|nr:NAD(P)H-binding protein [Murinocardiopsis flavida]